MTLNLLWLTFTKRYSPRIPLIFKFRPKLSMILTFLCLIQNANNAKDYSQKELCAALNGLPVEFYSAFWDLLCDPLLSVLNDCFRVGSLCASQHEALLRLIYKKDDTRLPKNWRPISLLNCDYKLASKIITDRLKQVMPSIVHSDQTCSVINRSIFSNLHLIRDTLDMINKTGETGILVTLDQMKTFDRVDHDFLLRVLRKFGFGPSLSLGFNFLFKCLFTDHL